MVRWLHRGALALAACAASLWLEQPTAEAGAVNIYSYRQEYLIRPFLDAFTARTGTKVNVVFAQTGMLERLKAEGRNSPADLVLTVDVSRIDELARADLLQPVRSKLLSERIPAAYRHPDGLWYALSLRARVLYVSTERVPEGAITRYEDLADPKWRGRICMRSSHHVYNRALMASIIAAHGENGAMTWLEGLKANLAMKPQGSDRSQIKAIWQGRCDIAIGNHYYYAGMKFNDKKPEQQRWADAARVVFPNQADRGTHVNISAVGMTKASTNRAEALALMEFLASDKAQEMYTAVNFEYPVVAGAKVHNQLAQWGSFKADQVGLQRIAELSPLAVKLFQRVGLP